MELKKRIDMKSWEVRALLDSYKTMMRRVVKPQNKILENPEFGYTAFTPKGYISVRGGWKDEGGEKRYGENFIKLPYQADDVLYVRETWQYAYDLDGNDQPIEGTGRYLYAADNLPEPFGFWVNSNGTHRDCMPWRPSIHMPKEAARLFLRVTDVRVERLQDITDDGVEKEGVPIFGRTEKELRCLQAFLRYRKVWNSTIKPKDRALYGWDADPWVWVVEFERISREDAQKCPQPT